MRVLFYEGCYPLMEYLNGYMDSKTAQLRAIKTAAIDHLGLDSKKDKEWLDHIAPDYVRDTLEDALASLEDRFMDYQFGRKRERQEYDRLQRVQPAKPRETDSPLTPIQHLVKLDEDTERRIVAFSKYLAKIASVDKNVLRYRKNNLGSFMKTMTEEEAQRWPDHPALLHVCRHLTKHYPWTHDEARYFVLCGAVPQAVKIRGKVSSTFNAPQGVAAHKFNHQTLILEMPAWLPSDLIRKAYLILQRQAHGGSEPRRPKERNVALFEYVLERARVNLVSRNEYLAKLEVPGTWSEIMRDWNELHGHGHPWHYAEVSNFSRDFGRGQQAVTGSKFALSGVPGQPMTIAQARAGEERLNDALRRPGARFVEVTGEEIS
jgi:hypothetical protein